MEGRKLQLAGGSTYLISLPKRWVQTAGLKPGDTLFLEIEKDGSVSVRHRPEDKSPVRKKVFEERGEESREHLLRKLIGAYISGFSLIELRFPPERAPFIRRVARDFCHQVIGPEVIEEGRNILVIQDLSDTSELSSEKCLRRMHLIVRTMLEDAVTALMDSDVSRAHDVVQRDQDVDRLYWMVAKQYHLVQAYPLNNGHNGHSHGITGHRLVAKLLERIGDHAERIASTVPRLDGAKSLDARLSRDLQEANASALKILDQGFSSLVTEDVDLANQTIDSRVHHQKLIDALSHRVATRKGEELLALGVVVDSLGRVASYAADIAEQAINTAVASSPSVAN